MTSRTHIAPAPAVELRNVSKRFGSVDALSDVSLRIDPGEVVAMLGPNGAGKTTAISIMLGIRQPTTGEARMFGMSPQDLRARSRCGVMLQETGVHWSLRVRELVELFRTYYPNPLSTARTMGVAGIADLAEKRAGDLSGGQRQRLAFALAICGNPSMLFLDEPTVGLDIDARKAFWQEIRRYARRGTSIVLTTHYMEEAEALADRIIVMQEGRIIADAPTAELTAGISETRVRLAMAQDIAPGAFSGLPVSALEIANGIASFTSANPQAVLQELWLRNIGFQTLEIRGAALEDAVSALTMSDHEEDSHARIA
jgi:ABC-2 type transport system ATP-binding protein